MELLGNGSGIAGSSRLCYNHSMSDLLPYGASAQTDPRKLREYALNLEHATGRFKAAFFAQMGYTAGEWQRLDQDIREQHLTQPAEAGQTSPFGRKYVITAPLQGPSGSSRQVTTVWIVRPGCDWAELVTIEPAMRMKVS
jgi:hypothetical protein